MEKIRSINFADFFELLLNRYRDKHLPYCILRNSDQTWENLGDIDVLVPAPSLDSTVSELYKIIENIECASVVFDNHLGSHRHLFISFYDETIEQFQMLVLDFQTDIFEKNMVFLSADTVLEFTSEREGVNRPSDSIEALLLIIHSVFGKGRFKQHYWETIRKVEKNNSKDLSKKLNIVFKEYISKRIIKHIQEENMSEILSVNKLHLKNVVKTQKVRSLGYRITRKLSWIINPPQKLLYLNHDLNESTVNDIKTILTATPFNNSVILNCEKDNRFKGLKAYWTYVFKLRPILSRNQLVICYGKYDRADKDGLNFTSTALKSFIRFIQLSDLESNELNNHQKSNLYKFISAIFKYL